MDANKKYILWRIPLKVLRGFHLRGTLTLQSHAIGVFMMTFIKYQSLRLFSQRKIFLLPFRLEQQFRNLRGNLLAGVILMLR
ncbi:hypothetical protein CW753_04995 [Klebsiella pneumoniae]|nr:hypothetical protein CW753_04995 [Klebsiella pneumoniae]HBX6372405.1 hypothetical protein [Klebsiella pneumoniae]